MVVNRGVQNHRADSRQAGGSTFELWKGVVALGGDEGQVGRLYQFQLSHIAQNV